MSPRSSPEGRVDQTRESGGNRAYPGSRKPESGLQIDENHNKNYENHDKASLSSFRNMVLNFRFKSFAGLCLPFLKFQCFVF